MNTKKKLLLFFIFILPTLPGYSFNREELSSKLKTILQTGDSLLVSEISTGKLLFEYNPRIPVIPASTLKIPLTVFSLKTLGEDFRFETSFYIDKNNYLIIKGKGDPFLISEEINLITKKLADLLKNKKIPELKGILIDDSYFEKVKIPGVADSENPYDVLNGPFVVNFNTINLQKKNGQIFSAEKETPLTPLAVKLGDSHLNKNMDRINLSHSYEYVISYGCELFGKFLTMHGLVVADSCSIRKADEKSDELVYTHLSTKPLTEILKALLKFSNNFIANQILIRCGIKKFNAPGSVEKGVAAMTNFYKELGWKNFNFEEGSGISVKNRVNPMDMLNLLNSPDFLKYRNLLKEDKKSGTLSVAMAYAGYIGNYSFVIFCQNGGRSTKYPIFGRREKLFKTLKEYLE